MYGGTIVGLTGLLGILPNNTFLRGRTVGGVAISLIGVNTSDVVAIAPGDGGFAIGTAWGIRTNAGTVEFKNNGGAWAPIAAAAAAAGGWTDIGTVVQLTTGTDNVVIGPQARASGANAFPLTLSDNTTGAQAVGFGVQIRGTSNAGGVVGALAFESGGTGTNNESQIAFYTQQNAGGGLARAVTIGYRGEVVLTGVAGAMVVNENGNDYDFRIESDSNPDHFWSDAGAFGGSGSFGMGRLPGVDCFVNIGPPAMTATANQNYHHVRIFGGNITIPAGTASFVGSMLIYKPNVIGPGTVLDSYTVQIVDAPTGGTNNGSLYVASGNVRFGGLPTAPTSLPSGSLWNNGGVVNIV